MKKYLALVTICLAFIICSACSRPPRPETPKPESIVLQDSQGTIYPLDNYKNSYLILNYWAPWCKPCHEEIPQLNAFYQQYKNKVLMFGVNYDHVQQADLKQLIAQMQIKFPVLTTDPAKLFGIKEVQGLPVTFIINKGRVVKALYGQQTAESLLAALK